MKALTCQILAIFLCLFIFVSCGDGDGSSNVTMDEVDDLFVDEPLSNDLSLNAAIMRLPITDDINILRNLFDSNSRAHSLTVLSCPAPNFNNNSQLTTTNVFIDGTFNNNGLLARGSFACSTKSVFISTIDPDDNTVISICYNGVRFYGIGGINDSATTSNGIIAWRDGNRNSTIQSNELIEVTNARQRLENNGQTLVITVPNDDFTIRLGCNDPNR